MTDQDNPKLDRKKHAMISMRLTPYEMDLLRSEAAARHSSVSATVRQAVLVSVGKGPAQRTYTVTTGTFNAAASATHTLARGLSRVALPSSPNQSFSQTSPPPAS